MAARAISSSFQPSNKKGAVPYILPKLGDPPVYTMALTAAFIKKRLEEFGLLGTLFLIVAFIFLILRGLKTLQIRLERHCRSAMAVARMLEAHPAVAAVHYPGLESFGQHALAYTALSFFATMIHRRLLWFPVPSQAVQVLPLFFAAHLVELIIRLINGDAFPGWTILLAPFIESLLWPVASVILLLPQRRAPDPDENRPL